MIYFTLLSYMIPRVYNRVLREISVGDYTNANYDQANRSIHALNGGKQNAQLESEGHTHSSADIKRGLIYSKPSNSD